MNGLLSCNEFLGRRCCQRDFKRGDTKVHYHGDDSVLSFAGFRNRITAEQRARAKKNKEEALKKRKASQVASACARLCDCAASLTVRMSARTEGGPFQHLCSLPPYQQLRRR